MFCPNCGKEVPEGSKFCDECGSPIPASPQNKTPDDSIASEGMSQPTQPQAQYQQTVSQQPTTPNPQPEPSRNDQASQGEPKKSGKSRTPLIIGIVVVIVIVILAIVMFSGGSSDSDNETETTAVERTVASNVIDLSQYLGYTEDELVAEFGFTKNPEGAYPDFDNYNFLCDKTVEMISIDADRDNDGKYTIFGIGIGTKEGDISGILGRDFTYSEKDSYDFDGESFLWYDDTSGGVLMIWCGTDGLVESVDYMAGEGFAEAAAISESYADEEVSDVDMEYIKDFLSDFNEVRAADMDSFTDAELLEIYNDLIDRIERVDVYGIGIDGMRSVLSTSELKIMSESTAASLADNEVLNFYEELCEHENDTDGTWFAEMREMFGLTSDSDEYILPESNTRYYTADELSGLTKDELRIARNEIYARHGRMFDSADLNEYFNSKSWYNGTIPAAQFNDNVLNDYEKKNAELIQSVENGTAIISSSFDRTSIFGTYSRYDSDRGIEYDVEIYFASGPGYDYIHFYSPYHSSDNIYSGKLDQVDGNVYLATNDDDGSLRITFQSNGDMKVEVVNDYSSSNRLDMLIGTYDLDHRLDINSVG